MKQENPLFYLFKKLSWPVGLIVIAVTISSLGSITGLAVPFFTGKLVDEFSSFARMPEAEIKLDNLSKCIEESFLLFSNSHSKIKMSFNKPQEDIYHQFDKFQITQCLKNLIKNSVEAVVKIPNPSIVVNLLQKNNEIIIEIIDNGIGVDSNKISKIFEPYYTTKNKGTGLGLSIVKRIIEDHSGKVKIDKNKNMAGTTSKIIFSIQNA